MSDFTGVFYIFLWISYTQAMYLVSEDKSMWSGNKKCRFADTIQFDFSGDKVTVNISNIDVWDNEKIWVGYFRRYTTFVYTGCVSVNDIWEHRGQVQIKNSNPGKCFSACRNNRYIGITGEKCYCLGDGLTNSTFDLHVYCESSCTSPKVACGGNHSGDIYLSVYRTSLNDSFINDKNCLSFDPKGRTYIWKKCAGKSSSFLEMCATENHVFVNTSSYQNWLSTVNKCFKNSSRPTDYSNSNLLKVDSGSEFWTGIISSKVIYTTDEHIPQTGEIEFGYLKRTDGNIYQLKFKKDDSDERYLCSTEQTTDKTTGNVLINSKLTTKAQQVMAEQKGSTTGVPVGISVAVVFVIAAVIIVIVVLKRRGLIPNMCYREAAPSKSIKYTTDIAVVSNNNYEEVKDSPYDKSKGTATQIGMDNSVDSPEDSGHYAHTYFVLEDNANHSKPKNSIAVSSKHFKGKDEGNVYNTLNSDIKNKNNVDNTYDTSETAVRKLKTQLSKEFDGQKEIVFNDRDEDTYNHINGKPYNKNNTDNVYGVNGNDYGDIQKRSEKGTDSEDTYNRIN
ncbi:uncharacterized protein LOC132738839 [Ruditapes philippinarum]|uniref:uncharacterized protein LOC132738839 n=1 Tax=Ruditapes philippinarum TaxID=129788 RepID=UPI00295C1D92|nr:uncharacterized protein LOC132738839 [Ruditapes philippinarum]